MIEEFLGSILHLYFESRVVAHLFAYILRSVVKVAAFVYDLFGCPWI